MATATPVLGIPVQTLWLRAVGNVMSHAAFTGRAVTVLKTTGRDDDAIPLKDMAFPIVRDFFRRANLLARLAGDDRGQALALIENVHEWLGDVLARSEVFSNDNEGASERMELVAESLARMTRDYNKLFPAERAKVEEIGADARQSQDELETVAFIMSHQNDGGSEFVGGPLDVLRSAYGSVTGYIVDHTSRPARFSIGLMFLIMILAFVTRVIDVLAHDMYGVGSGIAMTRGRLKDTARDYAENMAVDVVADSSPVLAFAYRASRTLGLIQFTEFTDMMDITATHASGMTPEMHMSFDRYATALCSLMLLLTAAGSIGLCFAYTRGRQNREIDDILRMRER